jgi:hypothetical protein
MNASPARSRRNQIISANLEKSLSRYALATASVATMAIPAVAKADFSGPYDPANWTFENTGSADPTGSVITATAPASITLTGGTGGSSGGPSGTTNFTIAAVATGIVSFDWTYSSTDTGAYDVGNFLLNGTPTFLADNANQGSGPFSIAVNAGDVFGFQVFTVDAFLGPGVLEIENFSAPVPESSTLALFALGSVGVLILMRRRARTAA